MVSISSASAQRADPWLSRATADLARAAHREGQADEKDQVGGDANQPVAGAPDRVGRGDVAEAELPDEEVPGRVDWCEGADDADESQGEQGRGEATRAGVCQPSEGERSRDDRAGEEPRSQRRSRCEERRPECRLVAELPGDPLRSGLEDEEEAAEHADERADEDSSGGVALTGGGGGGRGEWRTRRGSLRRERRSSEGWWECIAAGAVSVCGRGLARDSTSSSALDGIAIR